MHPYSTDDGSRVRNVMLVLAVGAILLSWGLAQALLSLNLTAPWWLDTPAVLGFYGLLWQLYDRVLWRVGPRDRPLGGVPNFAGRWKGTLNSSFDGQDYDATLIIRQTASRMLVEFRPRIRGHFHTWQERRRRQEWRTGSTTCISTNRTKALTRTCIPTEG